MDINCSAVSGRLVIPPLVEYQPDGSILAEMLVLVRSAEGGRVDVIPVTMPNPPGALLAKDVGSGTRLLLAGALKRKCDMDSFSTSSRLQMVADSLAIGNHI